MTKEKLAELLEIATNALADIAFSDDLTENQRRAKAKRIYEEIRKTESSD